MFAEYYRLFPHFGQNFAEGGNTVPQRLQTSAIVCSGVVLFVCCKETEDHCSCYHPFTDITQGQ